MNALATHVGDGRWVVETPRPVAEVDKVVTVPSPSMMSVAGAGPMQPMAAVWPQDGAWVAPFPGSAPGAMTGQGVGAPFIQVPSEPWFEGAGELAEVPEADDHGGCGTNEAFEAAYLAAAAEASARGVIEPGERREALIDALMEEAAQAERAKFEAMVASGEVKVWEDDEDETRFDPQGRPFELPKRLWQRLEEDAATEDETSSSTSSTTSPSPWLQPSPANPLVPPATWSATDRLHRCGHAVPLHTWTTIPIQGRGGASVDYSSDPVMRKAEAETRVKAKLLTQMHAPPRTLGAATRLQMVDTEAGWAGLVTPVGTKRMSVIGSRAFMKLGKAEAGTDDGSERAHWPLAMLSPKGESASSSTSLGGGGVPPDPPAPPQVPVPPINLQTIPLPPFGTPGGLASPGPTQGEPLPPDPPKPPTFGDKNLSAGAPQLPPIGPGQIAGTDCDDGEVLPAFPGYSYALDIEPGGPDFTGVVDRVVEYLHDGWRALERVQRYLPEERLLAWNDERGASSAGNPSMEHHFGPYSKTLLRELQTILADAAERWVLGFPRPIKMPSQLAAGSSVTGSQAPTTSTARTPIRFRGSTALGVCSSALGLRRTTTTTMTYIDICPSWGTRSLESRLRTLIAISIDEKSASSALANWLIERARAQGKSAPYPVTRCHAGGTTRPVLCAPPRGYRKLRTDDSAIDELLRAAYWATYFSYEVARASVDVSPADRVRGWRDRVEALDSDPTTSTPTPRPSEDPRFPLEELQLGAAGSRVVWYVKSLDARFGEWRENAWSSLLNVLARLGESFVSGVGPQDLATGVDPSAALGIQIIVVDALPVGAPSEANVVWGGAGKLLIRRDARTRRSWETMRDLLRALLDRVPDPLVARLLPAAMSGEGSVSVRASKARDALSGWVTTRYLAVGGCGAQTGCFGIDATPVNRPPLDPMVDATAMKNGQGLMVQVQWALTALDVYAMACTPAVGGPSLEQATASWSGAFGSPAEFDHEWSGHKFIGKYDAATVAQARAVIGECFQIFSDAGVNLGVSAVGQDVGPYEVLVLEEENWFESPFVLGSWRASTPRTLFIRRAAIESGEYTQTLALLQAVTRAAEARMVFKGTWTGSVIASSLAHWAAEYWFRYGSCVPNFTSAITHASFVQQYECGTEGIKIRFGLKERSREMRRRLREAFVMVEAAWRYLYRLTLLSEEDRKIMWVFGEGWLLNELLLKSSTWAMNYSASKKSLRPDGPRFPFIRGVHASCPSLRLWFGEYRSGFVEYLASTLAQWLRRISKGFVTAGRGVMFNESTKGGVASSHFPVGHVHIRKYPKKVYRRQRLMMHEWMHWMWYEALGLAKTASILNQGLPRDVKSQFCVDGDDNVCYWEIDALALAEHRSYFLQSFNQAAQNNDSFYSWVRAFENWNRLVVGLSTSTRVSGWPGVSPNAGDEWLPDPIGEADAFGCDALPNPPFGGFEYSCVGRPPTWVVSGDEANAAAWPYCSALPKGAVVW